MYDHLSLQDWTLELPEMLVSAHTRNMRPVCMCFFYGKPSSHFIDLTSVSLDEKPLFIY